MRWIPNLVRSLALTSVCAIIVLALPAFAEDKPGDYQLEMHVKIPMRDGVHLDATVYKPEPMPGPLPVIFMLSPYPDDPEHPSAAYFARHGYVYAYVDVRGRGDSEGVFHPLAQDAPDGYDVVEWFAKQPWCNGKVALFGGSYAGGNQWQVASQHPPHLATIAPVASVRPGVDFPISGNIMSPYEMQWLSLTSGKVLHAQVFGDSTLWTNAAKRLFLAKAPFNQFDRYAGNTTTDFQQWVTHPEIDDFWKRMGLTHDQVAGVNIPALVITGAVDGDQPGTLSYYRDHIASTDKHALDNYYLVIGPWDHPGTREPKQDFNGQHYEAASLVDVLRLHREWYDYTMKSAAKPAFLKKPVAFYVAGKGAECWKYADSLVAATTGKQVYYLDATGGAVSVYHSGSLLTTADGATGASFVSDPNDLSAADPKDVQPGGDLHGDGLIFHSAPFTKETEIDGIPELHLWLSIDAPDTDLGYALYLVDAAGKTRYLADGAMRARYRHSLEHGEAIHENQPEEYVLPAEFWFALRAPEGSQLRLIVGALNSPQSEKNWNSMKPVAEQSGADARVAHIKLLQSPDRPSTLTLPLGDPAATCTASATW
jgi:putative CocE/NonD family hydrolase